MSNKSKYIEILCNCGHYTEVKTHSNSGIALPHCIEQNTCDACKHAKNAINENYYNLKLEMRHKVKEHLSQLMTNAGFTNRRPVICDILYEAYPFTTDSIIRPISERSRKYRDDTQDIKKFLIYYGIPFKESNDAVRGGKLGNYIKII